MVLSRHYSVFHVIINKPSIYEALAVTVVEQSSFHALITCEMNGLTNVTDTLISKPWSLLVRNNYCTICDVQWFSHSALPTGFDLLYYPRSNRHWRFSMVGQTFSAKGRIEKFIASGIRIYHICYICNRFKDFSKNFLHQFTQNEGNSHFRLSKNTVWNERREIKSWELQSTR